ncbi:zona pellucida sperm-binding protein 4 isoform X2 [Clupea harengus]|uniref:Zona pellucida sperm-binding protein 4 isoform X2 n=1 Tax=Clupea harengus TaxID=7950 RepID=A0A6P8FM28_CLUHA|nr:zona pellucida sperm-binding protein 4 isoform X2 [Clupea harengus]
MKLNLTTSITLIIKPTQPKPAPHPAPKPAPHLFLMTSQFKATPPRKRVGKVTLLQTIYVSATLLSGTTLTRGVGMFSLPTKFTEQTASSMKMMNMILISSKWEHLIQIFKEISAVRLGTIFHMLLNQTMQTRQKLIKNAKSIRLGEETKVANPVGDFNQNGGDRITSSLGLPVLNEMQQILLKEKHWSGYCDKKGFHIIIQSNVTAPPLDLGSVHVAYNRSTACKPKFKSSQSVMFQFPLTGCGTKVKVFSGRISYWVNIFGVKVFHLKQGAIFRDPQFKLTVQCSYTLHGATTLRTDIQKPISGQPLTQKNEGLLRVRIRFAKDASYSSFYKESDSSKYVLGDPVFVEVFLLKREDGELVLCLRDCWATPTEDPQDQHRWNLLTDRCPFRGDSHHTEVIRVTPGEGVKYPQHHKRFMIKMFSFVKSKESQGLVYIHCNAEIGKGVECSVPSCNQEPRDLKNQDQENGN